MKELMVWKLKQSLEPLPEPLAQLHILISSISCDDLPHRSVEQAVLPFAVVADDVEDPDVADQVGQRPEVAGDPADLGDRLVPLGPGVGSRVIQIGSRLGVGSGRRTPRPSYGRASGGRSWFRSARSSRPP